MSSISERELLKNLYHFLPHWATIYNIAHLPHLNLHICTLTITTQFIVYLYNNSELPPIAIRSFVRHWLKEKSLVSQDLLHRSGGPSCCQGDKGGQISPLSLYAVTHSLDHIFPIGFSSPAWFTIWVAPASNQKTGKM